MKINSRMPALFAVLMLAAFAVRAENTSITTWLPHVNGVPIQGAPGSSTQANCEAANTARPITSVTVYDCRLVQRVTPSGTPAPAPTPTPTPTPTPSPTGASIAQQIAADMASPGDAKAHGIESWPQSAGAWSRVAASGLREEYVLPSGWAALSAWGQAYRSSANSNDTNTRVEIKDFVVYTLSKTGTWKLVSSGAIGGGAYPENYATNTSGNISKISIPGGVSVKLIKGFNFHFYLNRAVLDSSYAGVYATFKARKVMDNPGGVDDRNIAQYVMNVGGDYWKTTSNSYCGFNCGNTEIGFSRFKYITNDWTSVRFTNIPDARIAANPPPQ